MDKMKHPLGRRARVLLTSVFGPFAQDDEYGSRKINPMELYQNQVTRVQGVFSLRMFHRSFGLLLIKENLKAPCSMLDFPSLDRFIEEIRGNAYDIIGIGAIIPNVGKVKEMCRLIREHCPKATIVVGGHIANKGGIEELIDADHIVRGDGVRWFREYLGQSVSEPVKHPMVYSAFGARIAGVALKEKPGETAGILVPSVGCPVGCNFCSTSALFGGKGNFINFYETGDELYDVMLEQEKKLKVSSFFILDENFLIHRKRALRLMELMEEHGKSWALMIFSSARVIQSYTMEQIASLGISWVWMGLEGEESNYRKLQGVDTFELVANLRSHGIRVLGSSIIGLENHRPDNIYDIIDYAVSHNTDFHQFMLYTPNPGTPLYEEHKKMGTLYSEEEFPTADAHGQFRFNYRHLHIHNGDEGKYLLDAFNRDFKENGPSLARLIRTMLSGWQKYKNSPSARIRRRVEKDVEPLKDLYAGALWAMRKWGRKDKKLAKTLDTLLRDIYAEFGIKTRIITPIIGAYVYICILREEKRLAEGFTYEPKCFLEKNDAALALEEKAALKRETKWDVVEAASAKQRHAPAR